MTILDNIQFQKAAAFPLGVTKISEDQVQVVAWQKGASRCQLCLYRQGRKQKIAMESMAASGLQDIFSVMLSGRDVAGRLGGLEYDFLIDGEHIVDPYAREISGRDSFGKPKKNIRGRVVFSDFDWTGENWKKLEEHEMVLYQCHVRGFTRHGSSGVEAPGTFDGLREKVPYLKELGINTLLLLPVYDFDECMKDDEGSPIDKVNYWGYAGDAYYFAPKVGYSSRKISATAELQMLVKTLHQNGMNLILDMYFEGKSPEYILYCLRYYAFHFHVDGFRVNQQAMDTTWIRQDPFLSHVKILGNSWREQPDDKGRAICYEMNDGFLVDARRFLKSDEGQVEKFYHHFKHQRDGIGLIHYITQNNGFTMRDLVSYDKKHNEANGERNMDGTEYNYSWNCGFEGPSRRKAVCMTRERQERNAFLMLLLGMAAPMLLAGDEFGNSQKGNNNAYCQDNATTWLDWRLLEKNQKTFAFVRELLAFRRKHPLYHQERRLTGMDSQGRGAPDVSCHGREPWVTDFSYYSRDLGILFYGGYYGGKSLYFVFNFHWDEHEFYLPVVDGSKTWKVVVDTAEGGVKKIRDGVYKMAPRSITLFESMAVRPVKNGRKKAKENIQSSKIVREHGGAGARLKKSGVAGGDLCIRPEGSGRRKRKSTSNEKSS